MEQNKELIAYIVFSSSAVVLMLVVILVDIFLLYRKRKTITDQEIEIRQRKIDDLIRRQEVENVNALLKGQNTERRRISQELHDRLGGILFTAKLYNGNIERKINEIKQQQETGFEKLSALLDDAVNEVRRISHDLYQSSLSKFGYNVALNQLISAISESNDVKIKFSSRGSLEDVDEMVQQELYAITQEMLSNTLKHASANSILINLNIERDLELKYADNGKGFDTSQTYKGMGLSSIRLRVKKLEGELHVESTPTHGTEYLLNIPIA